jgi:coenzyme F420-0:L-glutamate ligase / coenzyme F420-1:gamma-L-glutamate ligase
MRSDDLLLRPLRGVPPIAAGDDLVAAICTALASSDEHLREGDVLVLTQKIVSKAQGRQVDLAGIVPSARAQNLAGETGKDPRVVELILQESNEVLRCRPGLIIVVHRLGFILANAGIDQSNVDGGGGSVLLLPLDPDGSAASIRAGVRERTGVDVAVLIIDSVGRPWRLGTAGMAIGVSGLPALVDLRGRRDLFGRRLETTVLGLADELAAAASIVMGQADEGRPIVLARGVPYVRRESSARELLRPMEEDLFR